MFYKLYRKIYKNFFTLEHYFKKSDVVVTEDENGNKERITLFIDDKVYVFDLEKRVMKHPFDKNKTETAFSYSKVYIPVSGHIYESI